MAESQRQRQEGAKTREGLAKMEISHSTTDGTRRTSNVAPSAQRRTTTMHNITIITFTHTIIIITITNLQRMRDLLT